MSRACIEKRRNIFFKKSSKLHFIMPNICWLCTINDLYSADCGYEVKFVMESLIPCELQRSWRFPWLITWWHELPSREKWYVSREIGGVLFFEKFLYCSTWMLIKIVLLSRRLFYGHILILFFQNKFCHGTLSLF